VLPDGEIVPIKPVPRAAEGPDLRHLFIGSEGTMGVIVDVTLKIFPLPEYRRLEAFRFSGLEAGITAMRRVVQSGLRPFLARLYDPSESKHVLNDPGFDGCLLFLGFEGPQLVAQAEYASGLEICHLEGGQAIGPDAVANWMSRRFDFSFVENRLKTVGGYAETIEIAHFWDRILDTYNSLADRLTPLADQVFGHFSHIYPQGTSLYMILTGQVNDDQAAQARLQEIWDVSMRLCLEKGAAISHHHGIGLARLPYIRDSLGSEFILLERVKKALDPNGIMNPGKLGLP
jgi:alkyldihydroxyacetonephosphate synthase